MDELVSGADFASARRIRDSGLSTGRLQIVTQARVSQAEGLEEEDDGPRNPHRDAQFQKITRLKKQYLKAGLPVLSMDTKKKELLGNFFREGKIDARETIKTNDHDFWQPSMREK